MIPDEGYPKQRVGSLKRSDRAGVVGLFDTRPLPWYPKPCFDFQVQKLQDIGSLQRVLLDFFGAPCRCDMQGVIRHHNSASGGNSASQFGVRGDSTSQFGVRG